MEFLFLIFILTLATFNVRAQLLFWAPYFIYCWILFLILLFSELRMCRLIKEWRLGYKYKVFAKLSKALLNLQEVKEIMKGVRFDKPHGFVCKCDKGKPEEEQTTFNVRFLTATEQAQVRDEMYAVSGMGGSRKEKFLTGSAVLIALKMGLLGWTNFNYEDTEESIEFSVANFSCIPPSERDEIANYIRGIEEEIVSGI